MKNYKGFAVVEGLLILVIVAILGGTGWYVYNVHNKATDSLTDADSANSTAAITSPKQKVTATKQSDQKAINDPGTPVSTASLDQTYQGNLKAYSQDSHSVSVKYPSGWKVSNDGATLKVTDGKASQTFAFGYRGFEDMSLKYTNTDFSVDGVPFVDSIIKKSDGTLVFHSIRFADTEKREAELAKTQFMGQAVLGQVDYPDGQGVKYRETLVRIYVSFTVNS